MLTRMLTVGSLLFAVFLIAPTAVSSAEFGCEIAVTKALFNFAKIPQNLNITFEPTVLLDVMYQQPEGLPLVVQPGMTMQVNQTAIPPTYAIAGNRSFQTQPYVVAMFDLDAPTPQSPTLSPIRHFLGSDFFVYTPPQFNLALLSNTSEAMSFYVQPAPTAGSDPHRYVWLVWEQPPNFDNQTFFPHIESLSDPNLATGENFNLTGFIETVGLGQPIGGSFAMIGPQQ